MRVQYKPKRPKGGSAGYGILCSLRMNSRHLILPLLIALCLLAYANSFHTGFHFDDYRLIRFNFPAHGEAGFKSILLYDRYRPVLLGTFAINYRLAAQNPFGYHLVNFSLHVASVILFFLFLKRHSSNVLYPALAAALMAVHPLNTEAVTYIAGRSIVLCAVFYWLAMLSADSFFKKGRYSSVILFFASFLLAGLSKEEAVTIPFAVLLYDYLQLGTGSVRNHRLFHFFTFVPVAAGVVLRASALPQTPYGFLQYWSAQPAVWLRYIRLAVYPVGQNVDPDITIFGTSSPLFWASLLLLTAILFLIVTLRRKAPMLAFWGFWFLLNLLPSSLIPLNDLMAEHRIYLSLFGFCAVLAYLLVEAARKRVLSPRVVAVVAIVLVGFYASATFQRNRVWQNEFTLWYDAVQKSPAKPRAHMNLAGAYIERRAYDKAMSEYLEARRIGGDVPEIFSGLGICAYQKQDWENAQKYFRLGLELNPQHIDSRAGLALVLYRQKRFYEALPHLEAVFPQRQESPAIVSMLANCYLRAGQLENARVMAQRLAKLGYTEEAKKLQDQIKK